MQVIQLEDGSGTLVSLSLSQFALFLTSSWLPWPLCKLNDLSAYLFCLSTEKKNTGSELRKQWHFNKNDTLDLKNIKLIFSLNPQFCWVDSVLEWWIFKGLFFFNIEKLFQWLLLKLLNFELIHSFIHQTFVIRYCARNTKRNKTWFLAATQAPGHFWWPPCWIQELTIFRRLFL